jgi:hypothetical protein
MDSVVQLAPLARQRQLITAEAKKRAWAAGSRRARWEIVEIVFWKGRGATSHSRPTWAKKTCPSKAFSLRLCWHDKTKALEGLQKLGTFVLALLLTVNMHLAQDGTVAQRLFIPRTSPPRHLRARPVAIQPAEHGARRLEAE